MWIFPEGRMLDCKNAGGGQTHTYVSAFKQAAITLSSSAMGKKNPEV